MMGTAVDHMPVLLTEVLDFLRVRKDGIYVDCTQGSGGHSEEILSQLDGTGQLIALDRDQEALDRAREGLGSHSNLQAFHQNFKELPTLLSRLGVGAVDGCLLDLGVSSNQLGSPERGFSFRLEGPLDMRMDTREETTAAQLLNECSAEELAEIFWRYGEEKSARRIATAIVEHRKSSKFRTTTDVAQIVEKVKGRGSHRIHPATRVFQALRIEVNQELAGLEEFLQQAISLLADQGRLVVISFHSLEDRIVKTVFRKAAGKCVCFRPAEYCDCPRVEQVRILARKPVTPSPQELESNPRARSAKLRVVEKIEEQTTDNRQQTADN
jgi:16S rRNA (cytosine1402-N4)-methyltransferase